MKENTCCETTTSKGGKVEYETVRVEKTKETLSEKLAN